VFRPTNRHGSISRRRLNDKSVVTKIKRYVSAAGLDPVLYSGHSRRAGLVASAARAGVPERTIMQTTGYKSIDMVLKYVAPGESVQRKCHECAGPVAHAGALGASRSGVSGACEVGGRVGYFSRSS
jgi:hypothetical protein